MFGDLAERGAAEHVIHQTLANFGALDQLVANAGHAQRQTLNALDADVFSAAFAAMPAAQDGLLSNLGSLAGIDAGAERERAEQLVCDKLRREKLGDDDDTKVARRLVGMLARRGYSQTMAFDVVKGELASERERRRV